MADLARLFSFTAGDTIRSSEVNAELNQLIARINDIDADSLQSALAAILGVSQTGVKRRGKSIVAAEQATASTNYVLLATPDAVGGIVLPDGGLIFVAFHALWKESNPTFGRASIFLNANALTANQQDAAGQTTAWSEGKTYGGTANVYTALSTHASGLKSAPNNSANGASNTTTGQVVHTSSKWNDLGQGYGDGGVCAIFADPGTYDVSVQFKALSGTVTVKERKLWVWAQGFG